MHYLTEERKVTGKVSIFAYPNPNFDPEDPDAEPFRYEISEGETHWRRKAIKVKTFDIELTCPAGVNLVQEAIATMRTIIAEKKQQLAEDIMELEEEISKLSLLTYQPEPTGTYEVIPNE